MLKVHDADGNRQLDRAEFADYITSFVHQAGYDFDQVIDYLITLTQQKVSWCTWQRNSLYHSGGPGFAHA